MNEVFGESFKVSEAEVFARGGIKDVLVSNQVRDPAKRRMLFELDQSVQDLESAGAERGTLLRLKQVRTTLVRMWSEP